MTEADWLAATDPTPMLEFLRGKASDRRLRLFAAARCRSLWHLISDERSRNAVEVAEQLADCLASEQVRVAAFEASRAAASKDIYNDPEDEDIYLAAMAATYAHNSVWEEAYVAAHANSPSILLVDDAPTDTDPLKQVKDIFGNPFSPPQLDPSFRTSTVLALAARMYTSRDFTPMPMLADALQDAGAADDSELVRHCRGPGPHVRGCHVLDGILGKS